MDDAYTLARYLLHHEHDAQDAVQEACLRAFRHYDPYAILDPRAWLLTIVRHCCYTSATRRRDASQTVEYDEEMHGRADDASSAEALVNARSASDELRVALDALPPDYREILVLREIQQLSYREISRVAGIPMGTVMSRLARARERLRDALRDASGAAG